MIARFIGPKKSMRYKPGKLYVLATTYNNGYLWAVDINGNGKPTPYRSEKSFLNNWKIEEVPEENADLLILIENNKG